MEGSGYTQIDDQRFDWTRNDAFCAPAWSWHEHVNASATEDAVLYSVTDTPALTKLGLYREECRMEDGGKL